MRLFFRKIYWRFFIVWLSIGWIKRLHLGDAVRCVDDGEVFFLINGVGRPLWSLCRGSGDSYKQRDVLEENLKKIMSFKNCKQSFYSGYRFYMTSWYDIWVHNGIKPWMKSCNIWNDKNK